LRSEFINFQGLSMLVFSKNEQLKSYLKSIPKSSTTGFVPTMGSLHEGHISLVKKAITENDIVVTSIFVNPTQFDKKSDLENYPKSLDADLEKLKEAGCNVVFKPCVEEIYNNDVTAAFFDFEGLDLPMEGKHRKGHFNGVGTIVKKLFEIITPNKAYFGKKDFQQLLIVKKMVEMLEIPIEIIACPIIRTHDGLAMSSRNELLLEDERNAAPFIYKTLKETQEQFKTTSITDIKKWFLQEFKQEPKLKLEYFEIADATTLQPIMEKTPGMQARAFVAANIGKVRLIDNIELTY